MKKALPALSVAGALVAGTVVVQLSQKAPPPTTPPTISLIWYNPNTNAQNYVVESQTTLGGTWSVALTGTVPALAWQTNAFLRDLPMRFYRVGFTP